MENLKVNHEFLEVENNVKKLWTGIQKLLKRNAVLKEMCQALEDHRASEREKMNEAVSSGYGNTDLSSENVSACQEIFEHEKERMTKEIEVLRNTISAYTDREEQMASQIRALELQVKELHVNLEEQVNETDKEHDRRVYLEETMKQLQKDIEMKDCEISSLSKQNSNLKQQVNIFKNTVSEQKLTNELLSQNNNHITQRLLKVQEEYNSQTTMLEDITQKCTAYMNQTKTYEDNAARMLTEVNKINKLKESWQKKIQHLECQKKDLILEKDKLQTSVTSLQKELDDEKKLVVNGKKKIEELNKEKEAISKNYHRLLASTEEQNTKIKHEIQTKDQLNAELNQLNKELWKKNDIVLSLEKEIEKSRSKNSELECKIEEINDIIMKRNSEILTLKKRLLEVEMNFHHQSSVLESIRNDRNICNRNLIQTKDEITELRNNIRDLREHTEELKTEIVHAEDRVKKEHVVIQKLERDKEKLQAEVCYYKDRVSHLKKIISEHAEKDKILHTDISKLELELQRKDKQIEQMVSEQEVSAAYVVQKGEEITQLNTKIKQLIVAKEKYEAECDHHLQEIKTLNEEIKHLKMEKAGLSRSLASIAHLRGELSQAEKELTKERIKSRALEEELQNPINIHRWRKLEGTDPDMYDLINKVQMLQKKILVQTEIAAEKQHQLKETEMMYDTLKNAVSKYSTPELVNKLHFMRKESEEKSQKIKSLLVEMTMYESQVMEWRYDVENKNKLVEELKKQLFKNKKQIMKLKRLISEHVCCDTAKDNNNVVRQFSVGGGFLSDVPPLPIIKITN